MKIVLSPSGTAGDIRPMVALGVELQRRGHEVSMVPSLNGVSLCQRAKLETYPFEVDFSEISDDLTKLSAAARTIKLITNAQFSTLEEVVPGNELVVGGSVQFAAQSVAEKYEIPFWYVNFTIPIIPSDFYPPVICKNQTQPRWVNRVWWKLFSIGANLGGSADVNRHRRRLGLPKLAKHFDSRFKTKAIISTDLALAEVPKSNSFDLVQTSYWHMEEPSELSKNLSQFLESNMRPKIFLGFGSVPASQRPIFESACDALIGEGFTVIYSGTDELDGLDRENFFCIGEEPHLKLFPKMKIVVHHGGSGTTHAAALAGVPQLIVPCMMDQFYWAHRVESLGIGRTLKRRGLQGLSSLVKEMESDNMLWKNAERIQKNLLETRKSLSRDVDMLGL